MLRGEEYSIEVRREYDEVDFQNCRLLRLLAGGNAYDRDPRYEGLLRVKLFDDNGKPWKRDESEIHAIGHYGGWTIVSDRTRRLIEASDLRRIGVRPTWCVPNTPEGRDDMAAAYPWDGHGEPWWELVSDVALPPMSHRAILLDKQGDRITNRRDYDKAIAQRESLITIDATIRDPEPRYLEAEITGLGGFDYALTYERFGGEINDSGRKPIVSHRFYRFCRDNGITCNYVPVRLD
jgi:hypothetical protein